MTHPAITRRYMIGAALLASAFASRAGLAEGSEGAAAGQALRFRSIAVDVSPLLDHGGGTSARLLAQALLPQLRQVFADRLAPGDRMAPALTARITNLFFSDYVERTTGFAFGNNDNIEGDGIVSGGGHVISSTHVLTELPPSYSGPPQLQGIDEARMGAIAYQFAYWLRREMSL